MFGRLTRWIDQTLHPEWYHGEAKQPPFFEGWYFKLVSPDRRLRYAIIPGIFLSHDPQRHHAFVQVFDGVRGHATYHRYPASAFQAQAGAFDIRIGPSRFTRTGIELHIADEQRTVEGEIRFSAGEGWPISVTSPGVMGWFGWVPIMECYHGVLSFDHALTGMLDVDGEQLSFSGGRGYIEKDWGKSFPGGWVWMQSNHFEQPGVSFSASIAIVPLAGGWFPGFLAGLWQNGQFTPFATYTGAKTERLDLLDDRVYWVLADRVHRLEISANRGGASLLPGPTRHGMDMRVPETLQGEIELRLSEKSGGSVLFQGVGHCAGLEVAGDIDRLRGAIRA
ncbi:MAG: tocopherol cyclase family protein [Anaerolineae bacterium]